ncbi:hypothetical protein BJ165DRAFT_1479627 [Panaeolus papilionaceus]|nr:hypothetical protein BJ165DRAFT_1479627 [Panaeolus papilionaceus]
MSLQVLPTGNRTLINHLTYTVQNISNSNSTFRLLFDHICVAAYDNSDQVDQMKCYPGTRTLLLERLENWLAAPGNARRLLTWLDGPMGSGKTAVARTMAERVSANNKLVGIFIFRRGQPGRNDATRFVATLSYQMALSIPLVRTYIEEQLNRDPSVLLQSLSRQLDVLILEPLQRMRSQHPDLDNATLPNLIIVDGLDECGAEEEIGKEELQTEVLILLRRLALSQDILPFSILINSRPEKHIKNWFSLEPHESMTNRLSLDASYTPSDDIRLFVTESFLKILRDHPNRYLLPPNWPYVIPDLWGFSQPVNAIDILVDRSSGQFIYGATAMAMAYIASQRHRPNERLAYVLSLDHAADARMLNSPTAIIDALYLQVLNSTPNHEMVKKVLGFYQVFGAYIKLPKGISLHRALSMVHISIEDLEDCLQQLESLLIFRMWPPPRYHHSSFKEFLEDRSRSGSWHINIDENFPDCMLHSLKMFHDETYVGAQMSSIRIVDCVMRRGRLVTPAFADFRRELEDFYDFPNSSYGASVERFLSKVPLSSFIRLTQWIAAADSKGTFCRHLARLIKPHIQPYLVDPASFARFLCWSIDVPGSRLTTEGRNNSSSDHRWPADLRCIVHALTIIPQPPIDYPRFNYERFCVLFSVPSMSFLYDALLITLKTVAFGLRHSRRWKSAIEYPRPRDQELLENILKQMPVSPSIWIYALDCERVLPDNFRTSIQNSILVKYP